MLEIEKVKQLAKKATSIRWAYDPAKEWEPNKANINALKSGNQKVVLAGETIAVALTGPSNDRQSRIDAEYIAAVNPQDMLEFIEKFEQYRAALEQIKSNDSAILPDGSQSAVVNETDGRWRCLSCDSRWTEKPYFPEHARHEKLAEWHYEDCNYQVAINALNS